ncbi:MarR family winged helix-turn-helix transcriptional regulator [Planktotalea arctica]|uniref:MarR family winged helix-turn-helix transcriptional regulator n=1 Tax=Planktotalea arctica TaxID=1481893 RepID=UPI000A170FB2|nr:hypothetical protein [Planktotalea arctica]
MTTNSALRPLSASEVLPQERLRVWLRLLKLNKIAEAELCKPLRREFATTLPRLDVMSAFYRHSDGLKISELSRLLTVSNRIVTGIVDHRAACAQLTAKGRSEFEKQAAAHKAWVAELLGGLDGEDCAQVMDLLAVARSIPMEDNL